MGRNDPPPPGGDKSELRRHAAERRRGLGTAGRAAASARIIERLFSHPGFTAARGVHCYLSMAGEVATAPIFERCRALGKSTFIPYQIPREGRLGIAGE